MRQRLTTARRFCGHDSGCPRSVLVQSNARMRARVRCPRKERFPPRWGRIVAAHHAGPPANWACFQFREQGPPLASATNYRSARPLVFGVQPEATSFCRKCVCARSSRCRTSLLAFEGCRQARYRAGTTMYRSEGVSARVLITREPALALRYREPHPPSSNLLWRQASSEYVNRDGQANELVRGACRPQPVRNSVSPRSPREIRSELCNPTADRTRRCEAFEQDLVFHDVISMFLRLPLIAGARGRQEWS